MKKFFIIFLSIIVGIPIFYVLGNQFYFLYIYPSVQRKAYLESGLYKDYKLEELYCETDSGCSGVYQCHNPQCVNSQTREEQIQTHKKEFFVYYKDKEEQLVLELTNGEYPGLMCDLAGRRWPSTANCICKNNRCMNKRLKI